METYLPIIKTLLSDWLQLTLAYPLYAAALATVVFLLTAILYSIRVASLKEKNIASEKAQLEMQNNLNTAQQRMQLMQEELTANTGQMEKDRQLAQHEAERAARFEEQLSQRNKQIAGIIQALATSFDLGERPLAVTEDIKAEALWQQHDRVITLLTTRLRGEQQAKTELQQSYHTEMVKRVEKEALIETLQTTLATQASQVSKLEQALTEQKSMLQQQLDSAQHDLSEALEKHQSDLLRLAELKEQAFELVHARQQLVQLEEKLNAKDALIAQLEKNKPAGQIKAQPALIMPNEKEIELKKTDDEAPSAPSYIEQQPVSHDKERTGGVTGKIKNLFGKTRQKPITAEPESAETKQAEAAFQPAPLAVEQPRVRPAKSQFGKLKNLFSSKQQPTDTQQEVKTQPVPSKVEQPPVNPDKVPFGIIKNLFGAVNKQPPDTKRDEDVQSALPGGEQQALDPDKEPVDEAPGKTNNIPGQLKKLYRKFTSKAE